MRCTRTLTGQGWCRRAGAMAVISLSALFLLGVGISCSRPATPKEPRAPREVEVPEYLKDTIGEIASVAGREFIPVQGLGFVTGLDGTGTKVVPPGVRQKILEIMRKNSVPNADEVLASTDTAVVMVTGQLPPGIGKGEPFDLEVQAFPNTDTTSLEGGFLLETELSRTMSARGIEAKSESLALGRGAIFVSPFGGVDKKGAASDPRIGRVLAGGKATKTRHFRMALRVPSVRTADQLVRIINARFPEAAKGTTDPGRVDIEVPRQHQNDKAHFLDLIGALYMRETPDARDKRIALLIEQLKAGKDADRVGICLESFGPSVVPQLKALAEDSREAVRFYVGRTLANLQDAQAVYLLEHIALNDKSDFQEGAVDALGRIASGVGLGVLGRALDVPNARVRVAAWRAMARLAPQTFVARRFEDKFTLSMVASKAPPFVYISRTLKPQIAIFGDVIIKPPVLAETRRVTATASRGAKVITLIGRRRSQDIRLEAPLDLRDLIEKVAAPIGKPNEDGIVEVEKPEGLDLDYSDVVGLLYEMSRKGALSGPLVIQPLEYSFPGERPVARPISTKEKDKTEE